MRRRAQSSTAGHRVVGQSDTSLAVRFPEPMLQLLDRLVPDDPRPFRTFEPFST